ncbi:MAG: PaaI family thioesterase [Planctomycetes bacterium]|nr:PaaI family thioesterase [Planctomycetota bacterium]MCB9872515.1 PaaI family thioesterase [Planctomycetota bacterium]MCB9888976.1 PaaI family thioesterase [Planctomycetota bacterium]
MMATLGAQITHLAPGECDITLAYRADLTQQHGFVHAGAISAIVDSAGGYAGYSVMPAGSSVLTVEFKLNLLAPARGARFVARGRVVKAGRTLVVTRGEVVAEGDGEPVTVAVMQQTLIVLHETADR